MAEQKMKDSSKVERAVKKHKRRKNRQKKNRIVIGSILLIILLVVGVYIATGQKSMLFGDGKTDKQGKSLIINSLGIVDPSGDTIDADTLSQLVDYAKAISTDSASKQEIADLKQAIQAAEKAIKKGESEEVLTEKGMELLIVMKCFE